MVAHDKTAAILDPMLNIMRCKLCTISSYPLLLDVTLPYIATTFAGYTKAGSLFWTRGILAAACLVASPVDAF